MQPNSDIVRSFQAMADGLAPKMAWSATTPEEHAAWRAEFDQVLRRNLGRMPDPVPLRVEWAEEFETEAFTRHKIYVQTEATYWAPAFLFVPKGLTRPAPAIVCLHGHSGINPYTRQGTEEQRERGRDHQLDFAPLFAEHGYVTLAPIQRGWNETIDGIDPGEKGCHRVVMDALLMGMTAVGLRCWDASRLIDFLETLDYVDAQRIGVAGLSGGGLVGLYWAAIEPRLKLAMIAGFYCTMRDSIFAISHCLCNCVPHMMEYGEMREIAALIAPRPLLIISGTEDDIFPIGPTRRAYAELEPVYDLLGAPENLDHDFFPGPHSWSNRKSLTFLARHFPLEE